MAGIIISCPNCNKRFWTDKHDRCPSCSWDPKPAEKAEAAESDIVEAILEPEKAPEEKLEMVPGPAFSNLKELNIGQLRPMARDLGIKGWYKFGKEKLLKAVEAALNA